MNYTVYKAIRSIDPGVANTTFSTTLGDVGSAILAVDPDFNNTVDNTLKQIQGGVNTGYNCYEMQTGGPTYADFVANANANTTLNFYESADLAYMESQPNVRTLSGKTGFITIEKRPKDHSPAESATDPDHTTKKSDKKPSGKK